jgi:pimeloyl-ACP methyl ester carboxylesterase
VGGRILRALAAAGRLVIRYDHRDTGQSTAYEPGSPGYVSKDFVDDAVGLLDAYSPAGAHIVGMSMGGGIAQSLALGHPGRVASLTLMSRAKDQAIPTCRRCPRTSRPRSRER